MRRAVLLDEILQCLCCAQILLLCDAHALPLGKALGGRIFADFHLPSIGQEDGEVVVPGGLLRLLLERDCAYDRRIIARAERFRHREAVHLAGGRELRVPGVNFRHIGHEVSPCRWWLAPAALQRLLGMFLPGLPVDANEARPKFKHLAPAEEVHRLLTDSAVRAVQVHNGLFQKRDY